MNTTPNMKTPLKSKTAQKMKVSQKLLTNTRTKQQRTPTKNWTVKNKNNLKMIFMHMGRLTV